MRKKIAALGAVLLATGAGAGATPPPSITAGRAGAILGTPQQIARDTRAARIFQSATVQAAIKELEGIYAADPVADLPDARLTLRRAAEANAMAQILGVLGQDPDRPAALWGTTAPHSWGNVHVGLSGTMIDNPDNVYRSVPIDGAARYEIRGRVIHAAPVQETFVLHNEKSGAQDNQKIRSQEVENGSVSLDTLPVARDGTFTITIDNTPVAGRTNHLQSDPAVHDAYILVRDTLSDWGHQNPVQLEVKRIAGPPVRKPLSDDEVAAKAAKMTLSVARYFLTWAKQRFLNGEANTFAHQFDRASGWGFIKCGWYRLEPDQALVVQLDRRSAAYLGFQLSDAWGQGQAEEYIEKTGSLTGDQARANADGSYTYVISGQDPGVHNWLDTGGLRMGTYCARWQALPHGVVSAGAVREMKVLPLAGLKGALPAETVWVSPEERKAQLARRVADFSRRLQY